MAMEYTTEPVGSCYCEQDCFGLFYEVLIISRRALDLYAVRVFLLTLPTLVEIEGQGLG